MEKKERIKALAANALSPIQTLAALEAMSDAELTNLEAHVTKKEADKRAAEAAAPAATATQPAAAATTTAAQPAAAVTAAAAAPVPTQTEEEWMKTAPASVRALVESAKRQEATTKATLVSSLKTAQKAYTEDELKALSVDQLKKLAQVAGITANAGAVDYSGLGMPGDTAETQGDVYSNPPDGYRMALDKMSGKKESTTH